MATLIRLLHALFLLLATAAPATADGIEPPAGALVAGKGGLTVPQVVRSPPPRYPLAARRDGVAGNVSLLVLLDTSGKVESVDVVSCDRPGYGLEDAALETVRTWRWVPVLRDGEPVAAYTRVSVSFEPTQVEADRRWDARRQGLHDYAEAEILPQAPHVAGRDGVTWPVVKKKRSPLSLYYPRAAKMRDIESRVLLLLEVGADGKVGEVKLAGAERHGQGFEDAARKAVARWKFEPASLDGHPVTAWHWVELDFKLGPGDR